MKLNDGFIINIESQKRTNPFDTLSKVESLLLSNGYLSIYLLQHKLRIGFTHASKIIDFLIDIGELDKCGPQHFSFRVQELKDLES